MSATAPLLLTDRLELWQPQAGDLAGMMALVEAEETRRFLGNRPVEAMGEAHRLLRNAGSWALYGYGSFILREIGRPGVVGVCGVFHSWRGFGKGMDDTPEAGWILRPEHCGKGLAGEAARAALEWFDGAHGPQRVRCMIEAGNAASQRLANALGFVEYDRHQAEDGGILVLYERVDKH